MLAYYLTVFPKMKFMKPINLLLIILLACVFSSCCTKKACLNPEGVSIHFSGYDSSDVDTLYITGYKAGSNFSQVSTERFVDSVDYHASYLAYSEQPEGDQFYYYLHGDQEWELYIPATNQTYRFRYFEFRKEKCNTCFLARDLDNRLVSFNVNGEQVQGTAYTAVK